MQPVLHDETHFCLDSPNLFDRLLGNYLLTKGKIMSSIENGSALPSVKGMAIASMVLGIVGIVFAFFCYPVGFICALVGLPLGAVAKSKISKGQASRDANGQAVTGIVLCIITVAIAIIMVAVVGAAIGSLGTA